MLFKFWMVLEIQAEKVNNELAGSMNDELYDRYEQHVAEAETARREAFEESIKRRKAEKDAIEARRRVIYSFYILRHLLTECYGTTILFSQLFANITPLCQVPVRCLIYEKLNLIEIRR